MSFDLFLRRFKSGSPAEVDRDMVTKVINERRNISPDRHERYDVVLPSGDVIQLSAPGLISTESFTGCAFFLRSFSQEYCHFIWKLARAGDMVICNMQGRHDPSNPVLILTEPDQATEVPGGMREHAVLAIDEVHLYTLLHRSFSAWTEYRDQVTLKLDSTR